MLNINMCFELILLKVLEKAIEHFETHSLVSDRTHEG